MFTRSKRGHLIAVAVSAVALAACAGGEGASGPVPGGAPPSPTISHVIVIVQENRTVDNLFNGFPGAGHRASR